MVFPMNYPLSSAFLISNQPVSRAKHTNNNISIVRPNGQAEQLVFQAATQNMLGVFGSIADPNGTMTDSFGFPIRLKTAQEVLTQFTSHRINSRGGTIPFNQINPFFQSSSNNPRKRIEVWMIVVALSEREGGKFSNVQLTNEGIQYSP